MARYLPHTALDLRLAGATIHAWQLVVHLQAASVEQILENYGSSQPVRKQKVTNVSDDDDSSSNANAEAG
jgi:hypothetical protein